MAIKHPPIFQQVAAKFYTPDEGQEDFARKAPMRGFLGGLLALEAMAGRQLTADEFGTISQRARNR